LRQYLAFSPAIITGKRAFMFGLFGSSSPAPVLTDKFVPFHFFDDGPVWRAFILYSLFVFDHALDAEKLHSSLERIVHKDGWEKLGARLRYNVSTFTDKSPM
jgi:hypothetical protein